MDEWISVNKYLPLMSKDVLVLSDGKEIRAFWDRASSDLGDWYDIKNNYIIEDVTHWMDIPENQI